MKLNVLYTLLLLVPLISSCQGEEAEVADVPERVITVRAILPGESDSRTHITYGNPEIDREIFCWHDTTEAYPIKDCIAVFNVTRLSECPEGIELETTKIDGRVAVFEAVTNESFRIKAGDVIFVNYWATGRLTSENLAADEQDIFSIKLGSTEGGGQIIVDNPDNLSMEFMQSHLKMYDIVSAVEDDKIPDLHFRHLAAIMRVTLRNDTGEDFWPKELKFEYPGTESFFNGSIYCSVDPDAADGSGLRIYDSPDFYSRINGGSDDQQPYTDLITGAINNYTAADTPVGRALAPGETYDLYVIAVPRIANNVKGDKLNISLMHRISSDKDEWYTMTIDGFNVPIQAGKRYWFNLTAVKEDGVGKLVFTNSGSPTPEN